MRKAKTKIHVNQHNIRANKKNGTDLPVLSVKKGKTNTYCNEVRVNGPCEIVYRPENPMSCGAMVWVMTEADVEIIK